MAGPVLPNLEPFIAAGINPRTGLPVKFGSDPQHLKDDVKKFLRLIDEQDACNRYIWYNIPAGITSQELERMLYYKGQLCFFFDKNTNEFYFMPYALDGSIDYYGRYNQVHPVPLSSGVEELKGHEKAQAAYLANIKLKCKYSVANIEDLSPNDLNDSCVLIHDYTKQLAQTIIPRCNVNDPILNVMAECIPYMRTSLILGSGINGVRVSDADQEASVNAGARAMQQAAQEGKPWIPILGNIEFQQITGGALSKGEEYMLAMQSLDNLRLSGFGIDNGGLFEKKAHELQTEADLNGGPVGLILQDGLSIRQNFCNIVNSIWGIGIWCEPAQNISGVDNDADGQIFDENEAGENSGHEIGGQEDGDTTI